MDEQLNVLIVDDNRELAENFMDIMNENGYSTVVAFNGESALNVVSDRKFDLGMIDMKLPDTTGLELIKKITVIRPEMEFIIITGHGSLENATEAVSIKNVLAFEIKPVDIERLLSLIRQISARKKLEKSLNESESRYKDLVDNSLVGINISFNDELKFNNKKMADIFGYEDPAAMEGLKISDLIHPDDKEMVDQRILDRLKQKAKEVRYECRGIRKDGTEIILEVMGGVTIYDGEPAMYGLINDITGKKATERELEAYRKNLEERISERTEELAKKNEELQKFNRLFVGREKRIKDLKKRIRELEDGAEQMGERD